jgi:hypothetical protein
MKGTKCEITPGSEQTTTLTLEVPLRLMEQVKEVAALEGVEYQDVVRCFVQQGVINNSVEVKRKEFAEHAKEVLVSHGVSPKAIEQIFYKFLY